MAVYNTRIKVFPDGGQTYFFYDAGVRVGEPQNKEERSVSLVPEVPLTDPRLIEIKARKRALNTVYDISRSNKWDWFLTLTLSPDRVDRWDYNACASEIKRFVDVLRKAGNKYLVVPEQHKNGAWHFHGLVIGDLDLIPATNFYTGAFVFDKQGRQIFNVKNYKYGINTATAVGHSEKAARYLTKYLTKKMDIPAGRNRYWVSKSLKRPEVEYTDYSVNEQEFFECTCDFLKKSDSFLGKMSICDFRADHHDRLDSFCEIGYIDNHEDIFVQIDPAFTWEPIAGEQIQLADIIEQNKNNME